MLINNRIVKCHKCSRLIPAKQPHRKGKEFNQDDRRTCIYCYVGLNYEELLQSFRPLLRLFIFDHDFITVAGAKHTAKPYRHLSGFETVQLLEHYGFIKLVKKKVILKEKNVYIADPEMLWTNRILWEKIKCQLTSST